MSAPRPYETDPFHPQSSVRILCYGQLLYIFKTVPHISSMWYLHCVLKYCTFVIYACALFRTPYFKVQRHFEAIFSLLTHWQEIQRHICHENSIQMYHNTAWSTCEFCEFTKGKGVKRTLITPCHPRSAKGQAGRFVQTD